jgi:hypothetical protein
MKDKLRSDVGDARRPSTRNLVNFLNELAACDLCRANPLLGICADWRVLVTVIERVPQKLDVRCLQRPESLLIVRRVNIIQCVDPKVRATSTVRKVELTGFISASRSPTAVAVLLSRTVAGLPSMSTTMTNLTPVLVSQPYIASLSSTAWRSPKSWSAVLWGRRASNMSKHDDRRNWNSSGARSSAGKSDMCSGLFYTDGQIHILSMIT